VPDDAFIARCENVPDGQLRALGFVHWIDAFRPEQKLHPALLHANPPAEVSVLVSENTRATELAALRQDFLALREESPLQDSTVLRGTVDTDGLKKLLQSDAVLWVEPQHEARLNDEVAARVVAGNGGANQTYSQSLGYTGTNVIVAVVDTGLQNGVTNGMHPDLAGRVAGFIKYSSLPDASDPHGHGTHVAGIIAGNGATGQTDGNGALYGLGVAPGAKIFAQRAFNAAGVSFLPSPETLTHDATRAGALIGNNSWSQSANGDYDTYAAQFDALVRDSDNGTAGFQPYVLVFSAGNTGPSAQTMSSPATAKNVIAVGASQNNRTDLGTYTEGPDAMLGVSARGPCSDGRIKPDLVAPGTWIASLKSAAASVVPGSTVISSNYVYLTGTSQSAPAVSGAAAAFIQFFRQTHTNQTPSPALVKAALINSASDMDNNLDTSATPNMDEGWGRLNLATLVGTNRAFSFLDQSVLLSTGTNYEQPLLIGNNSKPLKLTLAYTDVPAFAGASRALINDLDLELVSADGHIYRGNQFDFNGESIPDATDDDDLNNVEGIALNSPIPGEYTVRVRARSVSSDARTDTGAVDQDFALVISGDLPGTNDGVVILDHHSYSAPAQIQIKVIDPDQYTNSSLNVLVKSATETNGEIIALTPANASGVFTGAVNTATGPAAADGVLQIANSNYIQAIYTDTSAGTTRVANAVADLAPPVLTGVGATNLFGRAYITWQSSEPATSVIYYGTNAALGFSATNLSLVTSHTLVLDGLKPGAQYFFKVVSSDAAGNTATNNNSGALFSFTVPQAATVLLVDSYIPDAQSTTIPLSSYTDALAAAGVSYDVWPVLFNGGTPGGANLQPYRAVIWRVSDSYHSASEFSSIGTNEQALIQNYLNGGGSFLMASMEILSRLGDVPFRTNVLQVAQFNTNTIPYLYCNTCDENVGLNGDTLGLGYDLTLDFGNYPTDFFISPDDARRDLADTFTASAAATTIFTETNANKTVGIAYAQDNVTNTGHVIFLAFPLDAIPAATRGGVLRSLLGFAITNLPGSVEFTNNLWQANFTVSGATNLSRVGAHVLLNNAPPGQYIVTYGSVPFYDTPAAQTNTLPAGGSLTFTGNYTFADANTNGMSDAWEQYYFGNTNHTALTDADADGASDYAEFIAGTNPTNAASRLLLSTPIFLGGSNVLYHWNTVTNRAYRLESRGAQPPWTPSCDWTQALTTGISYTLPASNTLQFLRVQVLP
jgi:hypothetical protein